MCKDFMKVYIDPNHLSLIMVQEKSQFSYFTPHHENLKELKRHLQLEQYVKTIFN